MKHVPKKRFGQHFLSDPAIIDGIVRAIAPQAGEPMVEIGPGLAATRRPYLPQNCTVCICVGVKRMVLKPNL